MIGMTVLICLASEKTGALYQEAMRSARRGSSGLAEVGPRRECRLLVSVRNAGEARAAVEGGASIVDIKEPANGPLGRAGFEVESDVLRTLRQCAGRLSAYEPPVSVALGELLEGGFDCSVPRGVSLYKTGLSGCDGQVEWRSLLDRLQASIRREAGSASLVAVAYADFKRAGSPLPGHVLDYATDRGLGFLLIDTFVKGHGGLRAFLAEDSLRDLIDRAHAGGVRVALAGSLRSEDVPLLVDLGADVIAVRGAACAASRREGPVEAERVAELASRIRSAAGSMAKREQCCS